MRRVRERVADACHGADGIGARPQMHLLTQELVAGLLLGNRVCAGLALTHVQHARGLQLHGLACACRKRVSAGRRSAPPCRHSSAEARAHAWLSHGEEQSVQSWCASSLAVRCTVSCSRHRDSMRGRHVWLLGPGLIPGERSF